MFGHLAEVASSHGLLLHAAAHSFVAAFGAVTTALIGGGSLIRAVLGPTAGAGY